MNPATPETSSAEAQRDEQRQQVVAGERRRTHRPARKARRGKLQHVDGCSQESGARLPALGRRRAGLATAQGAYLLLTGVWPLVHYRSFEWVSGPKVDDWLVKCVGGLAATLGYVQLRSGGSDDGQATARRIGMGAAATFFAIDFVYGASGRISRIYLLDAAVEATWFAAWMRPRPEAGGCAAPALELGGKSRPRSPADS